MISDIHKKEDDMEEKSYLTRWAIKGSEERCGNCIYYKRGLDVGSCKLSNFVVNESKNCDYFKKEQK